MFASYNKKVALQGAQNAFAWTYGGLATFCREILFSHTNLQKNEKMGLLTVFENGRHRLEPLRGILVLYDEIRHAIIKVV